MDTAPLRFWLGTGVCFDLMVSLSRLIHAGSHLLLRLCCKETCFEQEKLYARKVKLSCRVRRYFIANPLLFKVVEECV